MDKFDEWLCDQLRALKTDEVTFSGYIKGILEEEEGWSEKTEGIDELLKELGASDVQSLREEIFQRWKALSNVAEQHSAGDGGTNLEGSQQNCAAKSADAQLDELLKQACSIETAQTNSTNQIQDSKLRNAILSNLSSESSEDEEQADGKPKPGTSGTGTVEKRKTGGTTLPMDVGRNANVEKVLNEQKEQRDIAKAEHLKKKERDKEDRAKQKAAAQERKDKTKKKSAKVERKR